MFATVSLSGYIIANICLGFLCLLPSVQFNALKPLSILCPLLSLIALTSFPLFCFSTDFL